MFACGHNQDSLINCFMVHRFWPRFALFLKSFFFVCSSFGGLSAEQLRKTSCAGQDKQ